MASVNSSLVTDAVVALLRSELSPMKVGDGIAPSPDSGDRTLDVKSGYVVVHRIPAGAAYEGSELGGQPESIERIRYQISAAGIQRNQAERISEAAIGILVDRDDVSRSRQYVHDLTVAGHAVLSRRKFGTIPTESLGTIQAGGYVEILVSVA